MEHKNACTKYTFINDGITKMIDIIVNIFAFLVILLSWRGFVILLVTDN